MAKRWNVNVSGTVAEVREKLDSDRTPAAGIGRGLDTMLAAFNPGTLVNVETTGTWEGGRGSVTVTIKPTK